VPQVAMGSNIAAKGTKQNVNKGKGKGDKKQGAGAAAATAESGKGRSGMKSPAKNDTMMAIGKLINVMGPLGHNMGKLMAGSTPARAGNYWTCLSWGDERCFASR
jgi:hypothetical protein